MYATIQDREVANRAMVASADDSTVAQFVGLIIEYVGSSASCLITTAANNTIASAVGAAGSEAADANFTVGSTSGTIDLTNASADTMGEVVDFINGLADYKARLVGCLRADDADTTAALVAVSSQQAKVSGGLALAVDTSVSKNLTCEISVLDGAIASGSTEGQVGFTSDSKVGAINALKELRATLTYSGGSTLAVYAVNDELKTSRLIFSTPIGSTLGATTVAGTATFGGDGIVGRRGERLLVRATGVTTFAVTNFNVLGATSTRNP